MAERPGVMVYFDKWEPMLRLSDTEIGTLFRAMLLYGKYGEVLELPGILGLLWDMIRPDVDRDALNYQKTVKSRKYAVYCREEQKAGREPLSRTEWEDQVISDDIIRYPTTASTPTPIPTPTPTPISETAAKGGDGGEGRSGGFLSLDAAPVLTEEEFEARRAMALSMLENYRGS